MSKEAAEYNQLLQARDFSSLRRKPELAKILSCPRTSKTACISFDRLIFFLAVGAKITGIEPHCKLAGTINFFTHDSNEKLFFKALALDQPRQLPRKIKEKINLVSIELFSKDICFALQAHLCRLFIPDYYGQLSANPKEVLLHLMTHQPHPPRQGHRFRQLPTPSLLTPARQASRSQSALRKAFMDVSRYARILAQKYPAICSERHRNALFNRFRQNCLIPHEARYFANPDIETWLSRKARSPHIRRCTAPFLAMRFIHFAIEWEVDEASHFPTDFHPARAPSPLFKYIVAGCLEIAEHALYDFETSRTLMCLFADIESQGTFNGEPTYTRCTNIELMRRLRDFLSTKVDMSAFQDISSLFELSRILSCTFFEKCSDSPWEKLLLQLQAFSGMLTDDQLLQDWRVFMKQELSVFFPNLSALKIDQHISRFTEVPPLLSSTLETLYLDFFKKYIELRNLNPITLAYQLRTPSSPEALAFAAALDTHIDNSEDIGSELTQGQAVLSPEPDIRRKIVAGSLCYNYSANAEIISILSRTSPTFSN